MDYDALKLTFVAGLKQIVLSELDAHVPHQIIRQGQDSIYLRPIEDLKSVLSLRSVNNVYLIKRDSEFNPHFISKHKSILGKLIETLMKSTTPVFQTFKLSCAGTESKEVAQIHRYITTTFKLTATEDADMEVYIGKYTGVWEIGVRATIRPLSLRQYKVANIKGGINPTIAYAMNTFCKLETIDSYLNIFSGSATLLIEAAITNPELKLLGFDNDGKTIALAVENIKKAGFVKKIHLINANIFNMPDLGTFDVVTSDVPFGMQVSKGEDLEKLYQSFVEYCEVVLKPHGTLVIYTSEYTILENVLKSSKFSITETLDLTLPTSVGAYLHTKILICGR